MDFTHTLTVTIVQAVLTLTIGCALAWFSWGLSQHAKAVASKTTVSVSVPTPPPTIDPDLGPRLLWKDARITELEHQIDRERKEHAEELRNRKDIIDSRNDLIANLRDELVLARKRQPNGAHNSTAAQHNAELRTDASQLIVAADNAAGLGDGGLIHGERDGKDMAEKEDH